jgi:hypothetical protein
MPRYSGGKNNGSLLDATKRFSFALDNAIYDVQAEARNMLVYIYDADIIINSILGLTSWDSTTPVPDVASLRYVTRALFSVGFLPRAHLLRPHLVEIERFIKHIPAPQGMESGFRMHHLRMLSRLWQLDKHDQRIKEYADNLAALESVIRSEGFEIFVKLELCYGGLAYDRLLRILPRCNFRSTSFKHPTMRAGDRIATKIAGELSKRNRSDRQINNWVDGYALSELAHHIAGRQPVRFYTETTSIKWNRRLRLFHDLSGRSVFRDAEYFIMRCSFPAVGFSHLKGLPNASTSNERTISDLVALNTQLSELLSAGREAGAIELERAIESEKEAGSGQTLAQLIEDFYQLKFLRNVFLGRWQVPEPMAEFVPYLTNFFHDPQRLSAMRQALGRSFSVTTEALEEEIAQLVKWRSDVSRFREGIKVRRREFSSRTPDPWRDLGLGRWGFDVLLPEQVRRNLSKWVDELADEDESADRLASDLALQATADAYATSEEFVLILCQLWCLKMYERLVIEWQENAGRFSADEIRIVEILYNVAQIKTLSIGFDDQRAAGTKRVLSIVHDAEESLAKFLVSPDSRVVGVGYMGEAHVTYWAWHRLIELNETVTGQRMAERSFDAAQNALGVFGTHSLAWAFAINHCVYVGTVANVRGTETESLRAELVLVNSKHNHYRFADTLARQFTEEVRREVLRHGPAAITANEPYKKHVCSLIRRALSLLDDKRPFFGDEEVDQHWKLLEGYRSSFSCSF